MLTGFAVFEDESPRPTAVFLDLDDAVTWALERFGSDRFIIRYVQLVRLSDTPIPWTRPGKVGSS